MEQTVVTNATAIGRRLDGIGVYRVDLVKTLSRAESSLRFEVFVSRAARPHPADLVPQVSPDHGTRGHLLRWLCAILPVGGR